MTEKKRRILTCIIAAVVVAVPFVCSCALEKTGYTIESDKIKGEVRLAFISDLHNSRYGENMRELVDAVRAYNPDAVVIGGDLYDEYWGEKNSDMLVERLAPEYKCFYTIGNHEKKRRDDDKIKEKLKEKGVTVLENNCSDLEIRGNRIRLTGLESMLYEEECENVFSCVSPEYFNVLIHHYPEHFPDLSDKGFNLILAGHAHGGQIRIPFILNGVYAPNQGLFPEYTAGQYSGSGTEMIVSRGLYRNFSNIAVPRVFNRPEIVFVTIEEKKAE